MKKWSAYNWQDNLIGKFKTEQEAWNFLDKCDLSGSVREEKEEETKE